MLRFVELEIGTKFRVVDYKAPMTFSYDIWEKVRAFQWVAPPGWAADTKFWCNASRIEPKGDDWDNAWVNSNYEVKVVDG